MANIIEHSSFIFDRICSYGGEIPPTRNKMRLTKGSNIKEQIRFFHSFRLGEKKQLLSNVKISSFYGEDPYDGLEYKYFAVTGTHLINNPAGWESDSISKVELDAPFFIYLCKILDLNIAHQISQIAIKDEFLYQQDGDGYLGHDIDDVINIFEPLNIIRISKDSILYSVDDYELGYYVSLSMELDIISLPMFSIIDIYMCLISNFNSKVPKDNIFHSLTSTHWKHCFLELYRCVEWLYLLPRTMNLKYAIGYTSKASSLANECVDKLSWRKKEEDSLCRLIKLAFENEEFYERAYWMTIFKDADFSAERSASVIYRLRNQFVHQFNKEQEKELNDVMWRELIVFTLLLITILYEKFDDEI